WSPSRAAPALSESPEASGGGRATRSAVPGSNNGAFKERSDMSERSAMDWEISPRAATLHRATLVWDDHGGFAFHGASALAGLQRWRASGIDYLSINVGYDVTPWTLAVEAVSRYREWIRAHDDTVVQVASVEDVQRARREGKLAVTFDLEGMDALNGDV